MAKSFSVSISMTMRLFQEIRTESNISGLRDRPEAANQGGFKFANQQSESANLLDLREQATNQIEAPNNRL